ncbi:MAG: sugar ABC transporter permease [Actinomycetota bacterium]|nr:sugar ABC transporter permease [Actinomycetota bacterium]
MSSVKNESVTINKMDLGRKPSVWEVLSSEKYFKWVLLIPLLLVLLAFMIYPMIYSIFHSFYDADLAGRVAVGLKNYRTMLRDTNFWIPLGRTAAVTVICIVSELLIGLGIATLWNRNFKGENIIRGLILLPLLVAPLILSIVWNFLLEYDIGFINQFLATIGLARIKWWDPSLALFTICGITVWQWFPFSASVLLAGLKGLPKDTFEAAQVDGAKGWQVFRKLTLPMLSPLIMIIVLLRTMWLIRLFDPLYGTTRGAVNTELLDWMVYRTSFVYFDVGYGSTLAIMSLYLTMIIAAIMFRQLIKALDASK